MKLNVYEKKKVVKTYSVDKYDLLWGTVEDVAAAIDIDFTKSLSNTEMLLAIGKLVTRNMDEFKKLLKDIFDGLTDEELRNTHVTEIAQVIVDVVTYTYSQLGKGNTEKN